MSLMLYDKCSFGILVGLMSIVEREDDVAYPMGTYHRPLQSWPVLGVGRALSGDGSVADVV